MPHPRRIDCKDKDWRDLLKTHLQDGLEVDLINFDYTLDGQLCETLALGHSMKFQLDAQNKAGFFKKAYRQ